MAALLLDSDHQRPVWITKNRGHWTVTRFVQKHTGLDSQDPESGSTKQADYSRLGDRKPTW